VTSQERPFVLPVAWRVAASIVLVLVGTRADPITVIDAGSK
jgi:hypothetical protein